MQAPYFKFVSSAFAVCVAFLAIAAIALANPVHVDAHGVDQKGMHQKFDFK